MFQNTKNLKKDSNNIHRGRGSLYCLSFKTLTFTVSVFFMRKKREVYSGAGAEDLTSGNYLRLLSSHPFPVLRNNFRMRQIFPPPHFSKRLPAMASLPQAESRLVPLNGLDFCLKRLELIVANSRGFKRRNRTIPQSKALPRSDSLRMPNRNASALPAKIFPFEWRPALAETSNKDSK